MNDLDKPTQAILEQLAEANRMTLDEVILQACNALANNSMDQSILNSVFFIEHKRQ